MTANERKHFSARVLALLKYMRRGDEGEIPKSHIPALWVARDQGLVVWKEEGWDLTTMGKAAAERIAK